jgi:hypothetical protein
MRAEFGNVSCRPAFSGRWRELMSKPFSNWEIDLLCATIAYLSSASTTAVLRALFAG